MVTKSDPLQLVAIPHPFLMDWGYVVQYLNPDKDIPPIIDPSGPWHQVRLASTIGIIATLVVDKRVQKDLNDAAAKLAMGAAQKAAGR